MQDASAQQLVRTRATSVCVEVGTALGCVKSLFCAYLIISSCQFPTWFVSSWKSLHLQDFATQVHFWVEYREQMDILRWPYGKFVNPKLAEHMSGQLLNR